MRSLKHVKDFKLFNNKLLFFDDTFSLYLEPTQLIGKNNAPSGLSIFGNRILFNEYSKGKLYSEAGVLIQSFDSFYPCLIIDGIDIMLCHENSDKDQYLSCRSFSKQKLIWKVPYISLKTHYCKYFYFIHHEYPNRQSIFCLNIETGETIWK